MFPDSHTSVWLQDSRHEPALCGYMRYICNIGSCHTFRFCLVWAQHVSGGIYTNVATSMPCMGLGPGMSVAGFLQMLPNRCFQTLTHLSGCKTRVTNRHCVVICGTYVYCSCHTFLLHIAVYGSNEPWHRVGISTLVAKSTCSYIPTQDRSGGHPKVVVSTCKARG